jgi:carbamoyl-phosphate synthase/aspartate carbamoyltransferase
MGSTELAWRRLRQEASISPFVKQIDTVAAEFPALTNYLYTTYNAIEHDIRSRTAASWFLALASTASARPSSSIGARSGNPDLREQGFPTIMVNYNPETVSTDYDEADRLYFENISLETILDIYDTERSRGVIFHGWTNAKQHRAPLVP